MRMMKGGGATNACCSKQGEQCHHDELKDLLKNLKPKMRDVSAVILALFIAPTSAKLLRSFEDVNVPRVTHPMN